MLISVLRYVLAKAIISRTQLSLFNLDAYCRSNDGPAGSRDAFHHRIGNIIRYCQVSVREMLRYCRLHECLILPTYLSQERGTRHRFPALARLGQAPLSKRLLWLSNREIACAHAVWRRISPSPCRGQLGLEKWYSLNHSCAVRAALY